MFSKLVCLVIIERKLNMELRERIIEQASNLFFHNGIKSITMTDIARYMGI